MVSGVQGNMGDNNEIALGIAMTVPIFMYLARISSLRWVRFGWLGVFFLALVALVWTGSRGAFVAIVAAAIYYVVKSRSIGLMALMGIAGVIAFVSLPQHYTERISSIERAAEDSSFQGRLDAWSVGTKIAIENPIFGGGFSVYQLARVWANYKPAEEGKRVKARAMHSIYFQVLADMGFVGLFMFLGILFLSWRDQLFIEKHTKDIPDLAWMYHLSKYLQVSLVIYAVGGSVLSYAYNDNYFIIVCLGIICRQIVCERVPLSMERRGRRGPPAAPERRKPPKATIAEPSGAQPTDTPRQA